MYNQLFVDASPERIDEVGGWAGGWVAVYLSVRECVRVRVCCAHGAARRHVALGCHKGVPGQARAT